MHVARHVAGVWYACGTACGRHVVLQVIFTTACELVRPKHVVPGTLKILQGQIQFTGDPPMDEGASGALQDSLAPKAKVMAFLIGLSVAELSGDGDMRCCLCMSTCRKCEPDDVTSKQVKRVVPTELNRKNSTNDTV